MCPVKCAFDTSYQETINSLGSHLNYRPDAQLRGRQVAVDSPVSLNKEKYVHMESSQKWKMGKAYLSTLRELKEKRERHQLGC